MAFLRALVDVILGGPIWSPPTEYVLQLEGVSARSDWNGVHQVLQASVGMQPFTQVLQFYGQPWNPPKPREWSIWRLAPGTDPELVKSSKAGAPHVYRGWRS